MPRPLKRATVPLAAVVAVAVVLGYAVTSGGSRAAQPVATPTPFHEGVATPAASPEALHGIPMPAAQDPATANSMTDAGIAMIQAAQDMETAAHVMLASGSPALVELGTHWQQDATALRDRGAWMSIAATSDSMVHDPNKARELDIANLQGNGLSMEAEGQAMADHGREMIDQVAQLQADGSVPAATADDLTTRGNGLITAGEQMAKDGKRMQDDAERLRQSLGA